MYMITACSTNGLVYPWGVCKLGSNATCLLSYMAAEFNMHKYFVKPDGGTREACHEFAFCTEYPIGFFQSPASFHFLPRVHFPIHTGAVFTLKHLIPNVSLTINTGNSDRGLFIEIKKFCSSVKVEDVNTI